MLVEAPDQVRGEVYLQLTVAQQSALMVQFVYIMASRHCGAIYIGRTGNLAARVEAHRAGASVHTAKYRIRTLVWFECHEDFAESLQRERAIKRWPRAWKNALIAEHNPNWQDVTAHIPV
ncbi:GIY-YIG nuclease family protein [Tabrizicola piscis]|nr:GIY-YIG nuclease family protein [Tabrizicola piscis]